MRLAFAFVLLAAMLAPGTVSAFPPPQPIATFTAQYVAGTVQVNSDETGNQAWGALTCGPATGLQGFGGGACFDVTAFPGAEFHVTVTDDARGADVGLFAGFDRDQDGCVGCTNLDGAWEGVGELSAFAASGDHLLQVFVRAVGDEPTHPVSGVPVETLVMHAGTSGTIRVDVYAPNEGLCPDTPEPTDVRHCGDRFRGSGPYPYESV